MTPTISAVIPVYNEEQTIPELTARVTQALRRSTGSYEILFVNDGSRDNSLALLRQRAMQDPNIRIVDFSRNFGHQIAISAGLRYAKGDCVLVLDADLQDPPEELPRLLAKWREGFEVVYAIHATRQDSLPLRWANKIFYRVLNKIASVDIPLDSGDFCLMDRRVVDILNSMPERTRFVRGLRTWTGFRSVGVSYDRLGRLQGVSKYTLTKRFRLAFDGFLSFSHVPLRLASWLGLAIAGLSFAGLVFTFVQRTFGLVVLGHKAVPGFATIVISILFLGGIQLIFLGILGEYIGRIFDEVKRRPLFVIRELIGFEDKASSVPQESILAETIS